MTAALFSGRYLVAKLQPYCSEKEMMKRASLQIV